MLVLTRYRVAPGDAATFLDQARGAVRVLAERPGCLTITVGRNVDDPHLWTLVSTWANVGAYRRALSHREVKQHAVPLMYRAIDEPTAYEDLLTWAPTDGQREHRSDLHTG